MKKFLSLFWVPPEHRADLIGFSVLAILMALYIGAEPWLINKLFPKGRFNVSEAKTNRK